jgi:hypothetical protein
MLIVTFHVVEVYSSTVLSTEKQPQNPWFFMKISFIRTVAVLPACQSEYKEET